MRQLNLYNFRKIKNSQGSTEFGHENFRRDDMESMQFIIRKVGQENDNNRQKNKSGKPLSFEYNRLLGIIHNLENSLKSEHQKSEERNKENKELQKQLENSKIAGAKRTKKLMLIVWMISKNLDVELVLKIKDLFSKNEVLVENGLFDNFEESKIPKILDEDLLSSLDDSDFFIDQLLILVVRVHNGKHKNLNNPVTIENLLINFDENRQNAISQGVSFPQLLCKNSCAMSELYSQESENIDIFPSVCQFSVSGAASEEAEFVFENISSKSRLNSVNTTFEFEYMEFDCQPQNFGVECKKPMFYKL